MTDLDNQLQRIKDEIGKLLLSRRREIGHDQRSVEKDVPYAKGTLSKLERGVSEALPSLDAVAKLEASLGIRDHRLRRLVIAANIVRHFVRTDVTVDEIRTAAREL